MTSLLDHPTLSRIRRNHGLEHATIHVLSQRKPGRSLSGHSNPTGFWILGEVETEELTEAVLEALKRMRAGEHHLAVHPHCGTNLVTNGVFAGVFASMAWIGFGKKEEGFGSIVDRLSISVLLAVLGLFLAMPMGYRIQQRFTTSGKPGNLRVNHVVRSVRGNMTAHRVSTDFPE